MNFSGLNSLEAYQSIKKILERQNIQEAEREAKLLISRAMDIEISGIFLNSGATLSKKQSAMLGSFLKRRLAGFPLQYAMQEAYFMGFKFYVDRRVLIPRPETELLAEKALEALQGGAKSVLDLCTGSGCIAVSIADMEEQASVFASDISAGALAVAKKNARRSGVKERIGFIKSDLFAKIPRRFDVIVSNPPYINQGDYELLEEHIRGYEPALALLAEDGLQFYRVIAREAGNHLNAGGRLFLEIGDQQAADVTALLQEQGFLDIRCDKDYGGLDRIISATI